MRKFLIALVCAFVAGGVSAVAKSNHYLMAMYYGNDSQNLLWTFRIDESLQAKVVKEMVKDEWSGEMVERDILVLAGKDIIARCNLDRAGNAWAVTDDELKIIAISEMLPYGYEMGWVTLKEVNGNLTAETDGRECYVSSFNNVDDRYPSSDVLMNARQTYEYKFSGPKGKVGFSVATFEVTRKR